MGSNEPVAIMTQSSTVGSLTVENCNFNGNELNNPSVQPPPAGTGIGSAIQYQGSGTFTAEYNYIHGMPADGIDLGAGNSTPTIEYNLFDGLGYTPGAHPDAVQFDGDVVNNALIAFNTIYQPQGVMPNEGLTIHAEDGSTITNSTVANNVVIATGPNASMSLNVGLFQDSGNTLNGAVVTNNYLDPTATLTPTGFGDIASEVGGTNLTITNNINLLTGTTTAPTAGTFATSDIKSVVASPSSGTEVAGNSITFTVNFDQPMTVTGTPTLSLNDGGAAIYTGGSGTNALTFSYSVGTSDSSVSALAITSLNLPSGSAIKNSLGDAANLSAVAKTFSGLQINTGSPAPINLVTNGSFEADSFSGWTLGGNDTGGQMYINTQAESGTYAAALGSAGSDGSLTQVIQTTAGQAYTLTFWLANQASGTDDFTASWNGTSLLSATNAAAQAYTEYTYTVYAVGSTSTLEFSARQDPAHWSLDNISVTAVAGPMLASVTASPASGDLNVGKTVTFTLNLNEAVTVAGGTPTLTLNDGGVATYTGGSGSNALTFSYTVGAGQNTAALAATAVNLNSATVTDGAGNAANLSLSGLTQSGPQIDTTTPTIAS